MADDRISQRRERVLAQHRALSNYNIDFADWTRHQARALRAAAGTTTNPFIDWTNLAEEIEELGKGLKRDLKSRIVTIMVHLIKLQASPAIDPRRGWRETIQEQRDEIEDLIEESPSLEGTIPYVVMSRLPRARHRARIALAEYGEQPRVDIDSLVYDEFQVRGDWFPDEK
jgi:hypothetical protein